MGFRLTPVSWRKADLKKRLARSERLYQEKEEIDIKPTGEEGVLLIKALLGLEGVISNVNLPNTALQIPNLPEDAVVETNAVFSHNSVRPIYAGSCSEEIRNLILPHVENHERIFKVAYDAIKGDNMNTCRSLVIDAFMNDPLVKGHNPFYQEVTELVDDMVNATSAYLPASHKHWKD